MVRPWHPRRLGRFLLEFVGNLDVEGFEPRSAPRQEDRPLPRLREARLLRIVPPEFADGDLFYANVDLPERVDRK